MEALNKIVQELKVPKARTNTFGNYNYRSFEDILEAVKPLLDKNNCVLVLSDEVVCVGNANYIKATAQLKCGNNSVSVCGWAREEINKKVMDAPQMTGTASSYARKYALNGLFCIDDTKDADTDEYRTENTARANNQRATAQPQQPAQATAPQQPKEKKRYLLTFEQAKELEFDLMGWLYNAYQLDNGIDVEKAITDIYECDFATVSYLRDRFNEYKQKRQKK